MGKTGSSVRNRARRACAPRGDRREEEAWLHSTFPERNNEWCASTEADIKRLFLDRKKARIIKPTEDNIWLMRDLRNTQLNLQKYDWYQVLNVPDDAQ